MFEGILNFFKKIGKNEKRDENGSKNKAKERLHLVLMQDRANVSADFLEMMKQEIIDVIKKYIEVEEQEIDVRLTNEVKEDGTTGAPSLYANIPIVNIKNDMKKEVEEEKKEKTQPKRVDDIEEEKVDEIEEVKEEQEDAEVEENNSQEKNEEAVEIKENKVVTKEKQTKK